MYIYDDQDKNVSPPGKVPSPDSDPFGTKKFLDPKDLTAAETARQAATGSSYGQDAEKPAASGAPNGDNGAEAANSGSLYNSGRDSPSGTSVRGRVRGFFWGSRFRKRVTVGSGMTGVLLGGSLFGIGLFGGTGFEFIHIAQLLEHSHMSDQQSASDQEMGKLFRYFRNGNDIGETRLTYLESIMKTNMIDQLKGVGLEPNFENGTYTGFTIDTTNPDSPYAGMDEQGIRDKLAEQGVTDPSLTSSEGKFTLSVDTNYSAYQQRKFSLQALTSNLDESGVPQALRWRILAKYGFVTWHPLKFIKNESNGLVNKVALAAWEKSVDAFRNSGDTGINIDDQNAETEENGKDTPVTDGTSAVPSDTQVNSTLSSVKAFASNPAVKITGGVTFAVGLACTLREVDKSIPAIRYTQSILPMTRMASLSVSTGNQLLNGGDVDPNEMGYLAQSFTTTGSNPQNWADSKTFQADAGEPTTGADLDNGLKQDLSQDSPAWLSWINNVPGLGALCSGIGSFFTTVGGFALGIVSGDAAGVVLGALGGQLSGPAISNAEHLLAGDAVNPSTAAGPDWGNDNNYGAVYLDNAGAIQEGATQLSSSQVTALNAASNAQSQQQFQSKSLAYRLFNRDDYRSLASRIMDSTSPSTKQNLSNMATGLFHFMGTILSDPLKMFSTVAAADSTAPTTYNYPIPQYGFSISDLDNSMVQDPYANAEAAGKILDNNNQNGEPDYISEAQNCFNVTIEKVSEPGMTNQVWDVIPGAAGTPDSLNYYAPAYTNLNCTAPYTTTTESNDWLRIRFFVFDTGIMEGYACQNGDNQSCANDYIGGNVANGINFDDTAANQVAQQASTNGTKISYALFDTNDNEVASYNDSTANYASGISNAMLLVAYLNQVGSGTLSSQAQTELTDMIENSDGSAASWVYNQLNDPQSQITSLATTAGMTGFVYSDSGDATNVLGQSQITAQDFAKFFLRINSLIDTNQQSFGLNLLSSLGQQFHVGLLSPNVLPGTVYSLVGVTNEPTGTTGAPYVMNQAAQFTADGTTYGMAVTISGAASQQSAENITKEIATALLSGGG